MSGSSRSVEGRGDWFVRALVVAFVATGAAGCEGEDPPPVGNPDKGFPQVPPLPDSGMADTGGGGNTGADPTGDGTDGTGTGDTDGTGTDDGTGGGPTGGPTSGSGGGPSTGGGTGG